METLVWLQSTIRDQNLYVSPPICIASDKSLAVAFSRMYDQRKKAYSIRHLIVTEDGTDKSEFVGLISQRDIARQTILRTLLNQSPPVKDVMTKAENVISVDTNDEVREILNLLSTQLDNRSFISLLPVFDPTRNKNVAIGVVSYIDILKQIRDEKLEVPVESIPYKVFSPSKHTIDIATPETEFAQIKAMISLAGRRTIPVLDTDKETILGMVTDRKFLDCTMRFEGDDLENLKANDKYLMIPTNNMKILTPDTPIKDACGEFLRGDRPDALLVSKDPDSKILTGILSYVDIFKYLLSKQ